MLRNMMDNPMVQQLMSNPEVMRQMISSNPQMQELMEVQYIYRIHLLVSRGRAFTLYMGCHRFDTRQTKDFEFLV